MVSRLQLDCGRKFASVGISQLFSVPGQKKNWNPFLGLDHSSGAATKKKGKKGATEQVSIGSAAVPEAILVGVGGNPGLGRAKQTIQGGVFQRLKKRRVFSWTKQAPVTHFPS